MRKNECTVLSAHDYKSNTYIHTPQYELCGLVVTIVSEEMVVSNFRA